MCFDSLNKSKLLFRCDGKRVVRDFDNVNTFQQECVTTRKEFEGLVIYWCDRLWKNL